jgi:hypothetical protein
MTVGKIPLAGASISALEANDSSPKGPPKRTVRAKTDRQLVAEPR